MPVKLSKIVFTKNHIINIEIVANVFNCCTSGNVSASYLIRSLCPDWQNDYQKPQLSITLIKKITRLLAPFHQSSEKEMHNIFLLHKYT